MGLWYYAPGSPIPILNVLKNTTALAQNLISVYLRPSLTNAVTAPGGEITFGGVNTARFIGDITYVDCVAERPWSVSCVWRRGSLEKESFLYATL
jgi:hypothetical protein